MVRPSHDPPLPATLGPYRILEVLGHGGMGVVYRAEDEASGELVALKGLRAPPSDGALAGLRAEIQVLRRVRHPGVVRLVAEGTADGLPWYAMELLEGQTLEAHLEALWRAAPPAAAGRRRAAGGRLVEALTLARRLCAPLAFLHGLGIVHRDLKPANIFLRPDGAPVLMDFGVIARFGGAVGRDAVDVGAQRLGTAAYLAPEQAAGRLVDARADLYALGVILFELLTGEHPFRGPTARELVVQHLHELPDLPSARVDGVPPALDALVMRLLEKRPRDRVGHAEDAAESLAASGADDRPPPAGFAARPYLYRPELAGREGVLAQLEGHLARLVEGHGACVLVAGATGIGKTTVVGEIACQASLRRASVVVGECVPSAPGDADRGSPFLTSTALEDAVRGAVRPLRVGVSGPLHPFRSLLLEVADRCRAGGLATEDRLLGARGKVLSAFAPDLADLAGQHAHPEPPDLPTEAAEARLFAALAETLGALSKDAPLLLVLEDLQWADDASLRFLAYLVASPLAGPLAARQLFVLGTYRTERVRPLLAAVAGLAGAQPLELGRLGQDAIARVVGDMLATPAPPRALVELLARLSGGNPFFVAEFLRAAVAEGLLVRRGGRFQAATGGDALAAYERLPLPRSLRELVRRRLSGLPASTRRVAEIAGALGQEVDAALLASVAELPPDETLEALADLAARQVLEEVTPGRYRFVHGELRESASEGLGAEQRAALHRAARPALERAGSTVTWPIASLAGEAAARSARPPSERVEPFVRRESIVAGTTFQGRYRIVSELAAGGFGTVYLAQQLATSQPVALKVLRVGARDPGKRAARFRRELRLCAQLHHPNIVRLIDSGHTNEGALYTVFDYLPGKNLAAILAEEGALEPREARHLMLQILDGLTCAHALGVIHRDLKPSNIMILPGPRRSAVVLDFGIGALALEARGDDYDRLTGTGESVGTPAYAAPEQLRGLPPTPRSDLYAWGLVFLECLTGCPVMTSDSLQEVLLLQMGPEPVPLPAPLRLHALGRLLERSLAKDPADRAGSAEELLAELEACDLGGLTWAEPDGRERVASGPEAERRLVTAVCCALTASSASSRRIDLEEADSLLLQGQQAFADTAERFAGRLAGALGDQVLLYFGHPVGRDDDARRAALAALAIVAAVEQQSRLREAGQQVRLDVQIGIHTGLVSELGPPRRDLVGTTPRIAARLNALARPGTILVGDETRLLLEADFELVPAGVHALQEGQRSPVFQLCAARPRGGGPAA